MVNNLQAINTQVSSLVVVDNGSTDGERTALREACRVAGCFIIENQENLGTAEALNQGIEWARTRGFPWVILFDQDSRLTSGFVDSRSGSWSGHPHRDLVATARPRYISPDDGREGKAIPASDGSPLFAMTSGSLLPLWAFDRLGSFPSEYFIDFINVDYSLRARAKDYLVIRAQDAVLLHAVEAPTRRELLGIIPNPLRRYYVVRNCIAAAREYCRLFPRWFVHDFVSMLKNIIKLAIVESDRRAKLNAVPLGAIDGFTGRMGRCPHKFRSKRGRREL